MFKKIITLALVLALCAGMISAFALTSSADTYASGTGTEADPYIISTEAQLRALAEAVNGGANQAGVFFKLGADITLTSEWTPIGLFDDSPAEAENDINTPFCGNFDGAGHKVEGLSITSTDKASVGLFGSFGEGAVVKNLTVNGTITAHARFIGAVVGITLNNTTIQNCVSNVVIDAKTSATFGNNPRIGGIVGNARGTNVIEYCVNNGKITVAQDTALTAATKGYVGGVAGEISTGTFKYCFNAADLELKGIATSYVGGLISHISGTGAVVSDCFAKGNVTANENVSTGCNGGIVSYVSAATSNCTISNCGYTGTITSPTANFVGYLAGNTKGYPTLTNCKTTGEVLFGSSHAAKATAENCVGSVANIDDIETAVKEAINSFVNPDTGDMQIVAAVAVAVVSLVGVVAVVSINRKKESV